MAENIAGECFFFSPPIARVTYRHFVANETTAPGDLNAEINGPMAGPFLLDEIYEASIKIV